MDSRNRINLLKILFLRCASTLTVRTKDNVSAH
nr:MAG TPA: hypothetical protein [Caudoviricetes sp.]